MQTFELEHTLLTHEADAAGLWRPDAAFRLMQEIAGSHSAALGFSREALLENNGCVWMIARAQLEVYRYPKLYDTIRAKTWYGEPGRVTYPRYVTCYDASNTLIAAFSTSWLVVDMQTRHILLPGKANLRFPPAATITPPFPEPGKIRLAQPGGAPAVFYRAAKYSDLDVNGHMNNANYVNWMLDLFPMRYHQTHRIQSLCIGYSAEAKPDEQVTLSLYREGDAFEVLGTDQADGHIVFEAKGVFSPVAIFEA